MQIEDLNNKILEISFVKNIIGTLIALWSRTSLTDIDRYFCFDSWNLMRFNLEI